MRFTFLGTSAGEGYPGFWCNCPNCAYAREHGGRNLRGNSCAMVERDTLIDMNEHFFRMSLRLSLPLESIEHLLVTHPHSDHFAPWKLPQRRAPFLHLPEEAQRKEFGPSFSYLPVMHIYGNRFVREYMEKVHGLMDQQEACRVSFHLLEAGVSFTAGEARVMPIRAQHGPAEGFCYNYIYERGGKTLLYASDTGGYDEETLDILRGYRYDCVVMEGSFGLGKTVNSHMSLEKNRAMLRFFDENALWKDGPNLHLTHMAPHWCPPHDEYEPMMAKEGIQVGYDGKEITI